MMFLLSGKVEKILFLIKKKDEVVVYRSFMMARLWFPLRRILVEILKRFDIYFHQLTHIALMRVEFLSG
jgi:hypothetical protein